MKKETNVQLTTSYYNDKTKQYITQKTLGAFYLDLVVVETI